MNPITARPAKMLERMAAGVALLAALVTPACGAAPDKSKDMLWVAHLQRMDEALAHGDVSAAVRARDDAYSAALGSRRWEAMGDAGDASLRLAQLPSARAAMVPEARRAYLSALFRARHQRSIDGVLRVAEAFAALGDRDAARQALVMASTMTGGTQQAEIAERMRAIRERLEGRVPTAVGDGSGDLITRFAESAGVD
jgi:hypothetical protein